MLWQKTRFFSKLRLEKDKTKINLLVTTENLTVVPVQPGLFFPLGDDAGDRLGGAAIDDDMAGLHNAPTTTENEEEEQLSPTYG